MQQENDVTCCSTSNCPGADESPSRTSTLQHATGAVCRRSDKETIFLKTHKLWDMTTAHSSIRSFTIYHSAWRHIADDVYRFQNRSEHLTSCELQFWPKSFVFLSVIPLQDNSAHCTYMQPALTLKNSHFHKTIYLRSSYVLRKR
jgi:hypothetical protein